jgi:transposase
MSHLSADAKHAILLEYSPRSRTHSFSALARRHSVSGGSGTVSRWYQQWDGSAASLQEKQRSGRPRKLDSRQVQQHVRKPVLAANRAHRPISYTQLLPSVQARTGSQLSLRTLQRYGKEELRVKSKATKKRTAVESESPQPASVG